MLNNESNRIYREPDGWYFVTRQGPQGPYATDVDAKLALSRYLIAQLPEQFPKNVAFSEPN